MYSLNTILLKNIIQDFGKDGFEDQLSLYIWNQQFANLVSKLAWETTIIT